MDVMSGSFNLVKPSSSQNLGRQHYMNYHLNIINGWAKSHFTLLKANKANPNRAKKSAMYQLKDQMMYVLCHSLTEEKFHLRKLVEKK